MAALTVCVMILLVFSYRTSIASKFTANRSGALFA